MKKYMFLYYGMWTPTDEMKQKWAEWFAAIGEHIVDGGNPLGAGFEISHGGFRALPLASDSLTGYTIVNAANMDEAQKMAETCPIMQSVRVYEAMSM